MFLKSIPIVNDILLDQWDYCCFHWECNISICWNTQSRALDHVQRRVCLPSKEGLAIHSYWKAILTAIFTDQGAGHNPAKSELGQKADGSLVIRLEVDNIAYMASEITFT